MSLLPPPEQPKPSKGASAPSSASGAGAAPAKSSALPAAAAKAEAMASSMLSSLRVSLMPSDLEGRPAPNVAKGLVILAFVLLIETVVIGGLYFLTRRSVNATIAERDKLVADIARIDKETSSLEAAAAPAVSYAYQLQAAKESLAKHLYWSPFFSFLEKSTLPSVKYLSFSGDATTGVVTVECVAGTYRDVAEQIISLRELPMVMEVRSNAAAAKLNEKGEIAGISFTLMIKIKPEAWSLVTASSTSVQEQGSSASKDTPNGLTPQTTSPTVPTGDVNGQPPAFIAVPQEQPAGETSASAESSGGPNGIETVPGAANKQPPAPPVPPQAP